MDISSGPYNLIFNALSDLEDLTWRHFSILGQRVAGDPPKNMRYIEIFNSWRRLPEMVAFDELRGVIMVVPPNIKTVVCL